MRTKKSLIFIVLLFIIQFAVTHSTRAEQSFLEFTKNYWFEFFDQKVLPKVWETTRTLDKKFGLEASNLYHETVRYWEPLVKDHIEFSKKYWQEEYPYFFHIVKNVPAPLKQKWGDFIDWEFKHLIQNPQIRRELKENMPQEIAEVLDEIAEMLHPSIDKGTQKKLNGLLEKLRPNVRDYEMRSCYQVFLLESTIANAFNTGCSVYVTSSLIKKLDNDNELMAVLAHELSHGDQGHVFKTALAIFQTTGEHFFTLIGQELEWIFTSNMKPMFWEVVKQGNFPILFHAFGKKAPRLELEADAGAVGILHRTGISGVHSINALMRLHGLKPTDTVLQSDAMIDGLRDYPSLSTRINAIKKVIQELQ